MKYDILYQYRDYLKSEGLRHGTTHKYFYKMAELLDGQNPLKNNFDIAKILENLKNIKYKNYFAQAKGALLHLCKCYNITLNDSQLDQIEELQKNTLKQYRKLKRLTPPVVEEIKKKIKTIKNEKLKLSYEMGIATGLRVAEIAQLTPAKAIISDENIVFTVIEKGGTTRDVKLIKEEYPILFEKLQEKINNISPEDKIFYSVPFLQTKAKKLGFKCHDLRRICAKDEYKKTKSKWKVKNKLGHENIKNTKIYLNS